MEITPTNEVIELSQFTYLSIKKIFNNLWNITLQVQQENIGLKSDINELESEIRTVKNKNFILENEIETHDNHIISLESKIRTLESETTRNAVNTWSTINQLTLVFLFTLSLFLLYICYTLQAKKVICSYDDQTEIWWIPKIEETHIY